MDIHNPKKQDIVDEIQGMQVPDPYRWLEDGNSDEVKEWIKVQNEAVETSLKNDAYKVFSEELARNLKVTTFSNPTPVHGAYFYVERKPDEDQAVLYIKKGLDGTPVKIFDPNGKRNGNTVSIDFWFHSLTGKYVAYGISEGGDEMSTIYVKNVETGEQLSDIITRCRHSSLQWLPDDSGFFYTRNALPCTVPKNEEHLHMKVYLHILGNNPAVDELIFGEGRGKDDIISVSLSPDARYLGIKAYQKWTENDIYIYDRQTKKLQPLIVGMPSIFSVLFLRDKVLLYTNYKANNYRVLQSSYEDMFSPFEQWKEFIPEKKFLLQSVRASKSKILLEYLVDVCSQVTLLDYEGNETGTIPLPKYSSLEGVSNRRDEEEFFYGVDSFVIAKTIYRYDPATQMFSEYRKIESPINPNDYEVKQEWYVSKDDTRVPMFIVHKKGLVINGKNPTVLYGYGGFNNSQLPAFIRNWIPWIEKGGIYVLANIRGGGEFGEAWHLGGVKDNKQNSFDDFIAAAEYLIKTGYTSKEHLGILGGSNGGLLVSAVGMQRPDLFRAICSRVPLTDMVRFPKFGIAIRWVHEYGNPEVEKDLKNILQWSPYHNVKESVVYPDFLFSTANKDTRVDPLHARKMAAMLQGANKENNVLVFTEMDAGHGAGKPIVKIVEVQALVLSFFASRLGLRI